MFRWIGFSALLVVVLTGTTTVAVGKEEIKDPNVSYRVNVMRSIGSNMGGIGDILKNNLPFQEALATHARNIESSGKLVAMAFEKEAKDPASTALPDIWKDFAKFKAGTDEMVKAAGAFAAATESGDKGRIMGALKELGGTCKECHKAFREKRN